MTDNSQYLLTDIGLAQIIAELKAMQDEFKELEIKLAKRELESKDD